MDADPHDSPPPPPPTQERTTAKPRSNRNQRRSSATTATAEKRNKANKACKGCRKKKVKCEGEVPCERCQKAGLECVFDTVSPAKRTSSRRNTNTSSSSQPPTRSNSQDGMDTLTSAKETTASTTTTSTSNSATGQQEQQHKMPDDGFPLIPAPADGISVSTTGRGLYIPDWLSQAGAEQSSPDNDRNGSMFAKPSDIHTDLLSSYFEHVHPYLPIIHRPTFQKQLQENKICELLLYAMYAVASRWQQQQQQQQQNPAGWTYYKSAFKLLDNCADAPRLSTVQALILMIKYHEHVRRPGFFWRTRFYFQLIVRMCQDLQLYRQQQQHHHHHHDRSNSNNSNSNSSIISNNSSSSSSNGDQPHAADTEQRNRLFWAVYAYDVLTSTEQGTVANFADCSVDFPQMLPEEDGMERDVITYFHWTAKIAHIHGRILTFLRSKYGHGAEEPSGDSSNGNNEDNNGVTVRTLTTAQEQKQRDNLVSSIDKLGKAMSAAIRQPPSADDKSSSAKQYPYYASRFLYMSFHFTAILLHRPYGEASAYHREQCFIAALAITQIASELIQTGGVECLYYCPRGVQQVIHYLAASITIHRLLTSPLVLASSTTTAGTTRSSQKDSATTEKRAREACNKSLDIIHQLIKVSPAVEIYADRREPTPPSPSPTPMEEVPISPPDRTAKARRVSKEFSGIRQNSSGGLSTSKLNSGIVNNTNNNNAAACMAMPPPPQPQQQQNTAAMNTTPAVNSTTLIQQQQQHSPYPQTHQQHPNPHRLSAPTAVMMEYASSMYLQQTPQPSSVTPYSIQQQQAQFGIPNFSQAASNFYSQSLMQQQQQINHHHHTQAQHHQQQQQQQQQQSNMYHQHLHQHQHHQHQLQQSQHHAHHQHQQHIHQQQQHPSTRRHTVSGDITAMSNFMVYPGITTTTAVATSINNSNLIAGGTSSSSATAANSAAAMMNPWPTTSFIDQDLQMDPYIQPSVAQSMMGLLMDQDENSMFAATAAAPAPP